jgi:hypothetical protein
LEEHEIEGVGFLFELYFEFIVVLVEVFDFVIG